MIKIKCPRCQSQEVTNANQDGVIICCNCGCAFMPIIHESTVSDSSVSEDDKDREISKLKELLEKAVNVIEWIEQDYVSENMDVKEAISTVKYYKNMSHDFIVEYEKTKGD